MTPGKRERKIDWPIIAGRISPEENELVELAIRRESTDRSKFVRDAVVERAKRVLDLATSAA